MSLLSQVSIHAFIKENEIKTETGVAVDFKEHPFLFDIYADRSAFICSPKAAQIGFTTYEILKSAHEAKNEGIDIIYVLPTADDVKQFSGGKTNRIIDNNPVLQEWTKDKDSVEQKRWGNSTIYYRGSWTERTALMISAQKLIVDEFDRCKQSIVEQYDSRLQHAQHPRKAFFSNPSLPDYGIDKYWKISDGKKWNITHDIGLDDFGKPKCSVTYPMEENCIDYKAEIYRCPECKEEITVDHIKKGAWYNQDGEKWTGTLSPKYEWSGWWIPLWVNPMFSAKKIAVYKKTKTPEYFANFVAGTPYVNMNDALSQKTLEKNLTSEVNAQEGRIIIGMDTGHNIHYTMMNKQGVFYHGYCPSVAENPEPNYDPYNEIEKRLLQYPNSILIADQGGDLIGVRKLQAKYVGRVFLCWFTKETKTQQLIRWGENDEYGKVLADRNRVIQLAVDQLNDGRLVINGYADEWQPYFDHWLNIYRAKEITDENEPSYGWRWVWKRKGADHWALATIYALIGMDRYAEDLATIISKKDFMSTVPVGTDEHGFVSGRRTGVRVDF